MRVFFVSLGIAGVSLICLIAAIVVSAHGAEMCAPDTNPTVCAIIEERNNSLDELAKAEGARRTEVAKNAADQAWWKGYLVGLDEQAAKAKEDREQLAAWWKAYLAAEDEQMAKSTADRRALADYWINYAAGIEADRRVTEQFMAQTAARMQAVCAWKGTLNEPTAQLCAWWRGTGR